MVKVGGGFEHPTKTRSLKIAKLLNEYCGDKLCFIALHITLF